MQGDRDKAEAWLRDLTAVVERPFAGEHYNWGACRIVADVVRDGGMPPLMIEPIDFMALYQARVAQGMERGTVVGIVCDGGWKYLSAGIWTDDIASVEETLDNGVFW